MIVKYETPQDLRGMLNFASDHIDLMTSAWKAVDGLASIQADYQKLDGITNLVTVGLGLLADGRVLDVGCNSGIHTLTVSTVARKAVGCDSNDVFVRRAINAQIELIKCGVSIGLVEFKRNDFTQLVLEEFDSLIMARVLYHIGDDRLRILMQAMRNNINRVIIQCRPSRAKLYKPDDIAITRMYGGLYRLEDCLEMLEDLGFINAQVWGTEPLWIDGESFPVIFATR